MRALFRNLGGFTLTVLINAVVSVVAIPFVIQFSGTSQWASIAVGQSVGSILSVFSLLGWALTGPSDVATSVPQRRGSIYIESVVIRAGAGLILCLLALPVPYVMGVTEPVASWLSACTMIVVGVGATWFYIGEANPTKLLLLDTLPRAGSIVIATVLVALTGDVSLYAVVVLIGTLAGVCVTAADIARRYPRSERLFSDRSPLGILRKQGRALATGALTATYQSAPVLIVQGFAAPLVPVFALADRIRMQAMTAYRPIAQVFQGWVPRADSISALKRRVRLVVIASCGTAVLGGSIGFLILPAIVLALSVGQLSMSHSESLPVALTLSAAIVSATIGPSCLIPLGRQSAVLLSALLGTIATAVSMFFVIGGDLAGVFWAVALGQSFVAATQLTALFMRLRDLR